MKLFIGLFIYITSIISPAFSANHINSNSVWLPWDTSEGQLRIERSNAKENFWKIVRFYESQITLTFCGITSSVIALNALSVEAPPSQVLGKYRMFTQEEFFTESVSAVINKSDIEERGITLNELACVLGTFPVTLEKFTAKTLSSEEMRMILVSALKNPNQVVLGLYQRQVLNQDGGGHWSPVAAYDELSDSFLILDVARYKYPPVWIEAPAFMNAMQTTNAYNESRGFIIIENDM